MRSAGTAGNLARRPYGHPTDLRQQLRANPASHFGHDRETAARGCDIRFWASVDVRLSACAVVCCRTSAVPIAER